MQSETTTAITAVKQDVRLREWAEQLEAQHASGLAVPQCVGGADKILDRKDILAVYAYS